ncbi:MAG TPA: chorismate pyruvate-lyase family protein [Rhizomicrobium sp.]|jgi:chorismate-pyruvate lyase|nr:chorismate pyruvate-lyase family protein [Rhizomicrobium sp.]
MSALDVLDGIPGIEARTIDPLQRILLITDGTLTEMLEANFLERIELVKLSQRMVEARTSQARLVASPRESLLERRILLRGSPSGKTYVYAESIIAVERLSAAFRDELLHSDVSLGRLWQKHRLETYKQLATVSCSPAGALAIHFGCAENSPLLSRSYHVFCDGRPTMLISEYFPAQ